MLGSKAVGGSLERNVRFENNISDQRNTRRSIDKCTQRHRHTYFHIHTYQHIDPVCFHVSCFTSPPGVSLAGFSSMAVNVGHLGRRKGISRSGLSTVLDELKKKKFQMLHQDTPSRDAAMQTLMCRRAMANSCKTGRSRFCQSGRRRKNLAP